MANGIDDATKRLLSDMGMGPSDEHLKIMEALHQPAIEVPRLTLPSLAPPPLRPYISPADLKDHNLASEFHHRLTSWIKDFEDDLDAEHEVGVRLVNFGQSVTFHLLEIGYWNPSLMSFSGETEAGEPVELIQHVTQISILLMKVKRVDPTKPTRRIGFNNEETDTEQ